MVVYPAKVPGDKTGMCANATCIKSHSGNASASPFRASTEKFLEAKPASVFRNRIAAILQRDSEVVIVLAWPAKQKLVRGGRIGTPLLTT